MDNLIAHVPTNLWWFLGCAVLFTLLARLFACNKDIRSWHDESFTNILYWFLPPVLYVVVYPLLVVGTLLLIFRFDQGRVDEFVNVRGLPATWPIWLQVVSILLVSDFIQYWLHRWFHGRSMWRFHAIHHSAKQLDWMVSTRFHPVNFILYATLTSVVTFVMGFSAEAFVLLQPFNILYSAMVHANLNWTFGPLRYVFASPVFHRWHHTMLAEGRDKNFAPTFPVLDLMFGTFYMPGGRLPEQYGIDDDSMPKDFVMQMLYPFKK